MNEREFWIMIRRALLMIVEAIERRYDIQPLTSMLRKAERRINAE